MDPIQEQTKEFTINILINESFNKAIESYNNIFNQYYPAHDSTGFTERNLTSNFAESLKYFLGEKSFIWFETPINPENKKEHIDAVVFSKVKNSILLIESKRLGQEVNKQIVSLKRDIERIDSKINNNINKIFHIINNLEWKDNSTCIYILFICDYWCEKGKKINEIEKIIQESFKYFKILAKKGFNTGNKELCLQKYSIFIGWKKLE